MTAKSRRYLEGILSAQMAVGEITGNQPMDTMTDAMWDMVLQLQSRLTSMALDEAKRLAEDA